MILYGSYLAFKNWDHFPTLITPARNVFNKICANTSSSCKGTFYNGSVSFIVHTKTVGKLMPVNPERPKLLIGFSAALSISEE